MVLVQDYQWNLMKHGVYINHRGKVVQGEFVTSAAAAAAAAKVAG